MKTLLRTLYVFVLRSVKPKAGLTKLVFNRFVTWLVSGLDPIRSTRMADGTAMEVDLRDFNGRKLWASGTNDWKISELAARLVRPGDIFLDIGANYGTVGLPLRHAVGPQGHVHLFEPQPVLVGRLERAIADSGDGNVTVHGVALFDRDGALEMNLPRQHTGAASLIDAKPGGSGTITVETHRTGDYLAPIVGDRPFGVKMDVEGAEKHVLPDILKFGALRFVIFEGNRDQSVLFDIFRDSDLEVFGFGRTLLKLRLVAAPRLEDWSKFHDFVAVRDPSVLEGLVSR